MIIASEVIENSFTAQITPYLPILGVIFGGIVVGLFALWNRKKGNYETRAPDVNEIWQQQARDAHDLDMERKWRRRLDSFAYELVRVFRAYVLRVQSGGDTQLTPHERLFHDADPPSSEINVQDKK